MQVLLTDTVSPAARTAAQALASDGYVVHTCHDEHDPFHCVADLGERCPLDRHPIDVVVAVRAADDGGRCGVRRKVPVAVVASSPADAAATVAATARHSLCTHSMTAAEAFRRSLATAGLPADAAVDVHRRDGFLKVTIETPFPVPEAVAQRGAVRICQALREIDPDARGIDVASPKVVPQ